MRSRGILVAVSVAAMLIAGCSGSISERRKIDYQSAGRLPPLEVPPDLATPRNSERYNVPPEDGATFSDYTRQRDAARGGEDTSILPTEAGMKVEREGVFRWLKIKAEPEELWQPLREFWQETGFLIAYEIPEAGIMETDWAENRAKVPLGAVRTFIKSVFDSAYSYPERDRFRTRVERSDEPGYSEIYISHRAMYEVVIQVGRNQGEQTLWQVRPTDPELEAEMLYRLMAQLGGTQEQIQQAKNSPAPPPRATLSRSQNLEFLEVRDPFDKAWRRVGLALDRVGFTVEDRDRAQGVYFVRYNDPDAENKKKGIGRLAFWRDADNADTQYHIQVSGANDDRKVSEVRVQDAEGQTVASSTASRILALLQQELK